MTTTQLPRLGELDYNLRNRGPWTTMEYSVWPGFNIGQTTALSSNAGNHFGDPDQRDLFHSLLPSRSIHYPQQVHSSTVRQVQGSSSCYPNTDGLVGVRQGDLLSVLTADCLPVYIREHTSCRFALLHVGWRGLVKGIVPRTLEEYFSEPVHMLVGAGIGPESYEVGTDVIKQLVSTFECSPEELHRRGILREESGEKAYLDLMQAVRHQAAASPRTVREVLYLPVDTARPGSIPLHSYRANGTDKRMVNWMVRTF